MAPQVMLGLPSISFPLGWLDIIPALNISRDCRDHPPDFHHVCLEGYGSQTIFKSWCTQNHIIFGWREAHLRFIQARGHRFFGSYYIRKRYHFNTNMPPKLLLQTLHGFCPIIGINHWRYQSIRMFPFALLDLTQKAQVIQRYIGFYCHPSGTYFMLKEEAVNIQVVFGPQGDL